MKLTLNMPLMVFLCGFLISSTYSFAASPPPANTKDRIYVGAFSKGNLEGWKQKTFAGKTEYSLVIDKNLTPQLHVLQANSGHGASGLVFTKRINLEQTPWLHWSWKTEHLYTKLDERKKNGDDFVARIYIILDGGMFFWNTHALNYVWSSFFKTGASWPNPYTSNATMFAVESGDSKLRQWQHYSRNVRDDLKQLMGKDVRYVDAIAVMTDSDNTGQKATTFYGDIYFSASL